MRDDGKDEGGWLWVAAISMALWFIVVAVLRWLLETPR
jgi:hypothetical protein